MNKYFLLFLTFQFTVFCYAQLSSLSSNRRLTDKYEITNYTVKNGLPSMQVYDVIEDEYGYLWFSTDKGLCRYDGKKFEVFDTKNGLIDNTVFDFYPTQDSGIWCATYRSGLFNIKGILPTFTSYQYNNIIKKYSKDRAPNSLHFDSLGNTYLAFHSNAGYSLSSTSNKRIYL